MSTTATAPRTRKSKSSAGVTNGTAQAATAASAAINAALATPTGPNPAEIELKIQKWEELKAAAKELYTAADNLSSELIKAIGVGNCLQLSDKRMVKIVDNFIDASGNVKVKHYGLCGVARFEMKVK